MRQNGLNQILNFSLKVGPSNVYINGPEELEHNQKAEISCFSDESNPPSDLAVTVRGDNDKSQ